NRDFPGSAPQGNEPFSANVDDDSNEFIDYNTFMGSIKKKIVSKNFRGGTISCVMGGTELDLSQADIQKPAIIDISQLFGGTKIVVPAHWDIKSEVSAMFGGFEDKRNISSNVIDSNKTLLLKGSTLFGGIEISN
ncbi:MAG: LiaF domain-containing protein, partial [Chitinophagaceae bacterium]